ncbi:MAG: ABC transporter ATP-binding protein [Deltaproteobacteria bacterium]|nr:ABC transporter ATP-binding protein [Deltaproteobacteria bacterium]
MSLKIENLSVVYRDGDHAIQALEKVHLSLTPGRIVALVGESGSGKTSLGRACLGLLPPNAVIQGRISLNGQTLTGLDEDSLNQIRWAKLAMVFQNGAANLNPVHRVIDQVAEPLLEHGPVQAAQEARARAAEALSEVGLDRARHLCFPHQLSGGQIQLVLLAMATILDPEALILDEPTAALDAMSKAFVAGLVRQARDRGRAVLLISHDLELAAGLADEVSVIYLGQIMETMPAQDLLARPLHPYTLALGRSYPAMTTARDLGGIRGDAFYRILHQHGRGQEEAHGHTHILTSDSSHEDGHAPPRGCLFRPRCTQAVDLCSSQAIDLEAAGSHQVRCLRGGIAYLLELNQVSKRYGQTLALDKTDLTLKAGEVFCLVGETGSGKTTLALIAAGALKPDSGARVFDGQDMEAWIERDYRSLARRIGVIYQNPAQSVSHRLSVFKTVAEPLNIHHLPQSRAETRERVAKVLAEVHLSTDPAFLSRYPHELNMGAIQRVCLARALVLEPSLLIADEPTSSLDPSVQAKVMKLLLNLQIDKGLTMLFVTHNIGLARKIGDRLGVMLAGRLVEIGPAQQVLAAPGHPYTKLLIDSVSRLAQSPEQLNPEATDSQGCPFVGRCGRAEEVCHKQRPKLERAGYGQVACHFPIT